MRAVSKQIKQQRRKIGEICFKPRNNNCKYRALVEVGRSEESKYYINKQVVTLRCTHPYTQTVLPKMLPVLVTYIHTYVCGSSCDLRPLDFVTLPTQKYICMYMCTCVPLSLPHYPWLALSILPLLSSTPILSQTTGTCLCVKILFVQEGCGGYWINSWSYTKIVMVYICVHICWNLKRKWDITVLHTR